MSQENVELVRRIYDAWDAATESARDYIAEDVEYVNPGYAVEPGTRRGRRALRWCGIATRTSTSDRELIDAGGDDVVVLARYAASGRGSGVEVAGEHGYVWTVQEGLAVRFQWFQSAREALEAAGLSE